MEIDAQIQALIDHAPQDGTTPAVVAAIAPVLKRLASRLRHSEYYIPQTLDQAWAITTLSNRTQPELEKNVVYAYATLKDVAAGPYPMQDPQMIALPVPVTHILFQMLAMEGIDSTIFFELPGNVETGTEIQRQDVNDLIQSQLPHLLENQLIEPSLPPDIA